MKFTVAEFFSGCGGFSRGFARTGSFSTVLANDIKQEALQTFERNHGGPDQRPKIVRQDIRTVPLNTIDDLLDQQGVRRGELDCLIGGPPCQGFSQLRRSEERDTGQIVKFRGYSKLSEDPRNDLVLRYLEVAERLKPKYILIENVPQMLNHGFQGRLGHLSETVIDILQKDLGYSVAVKVLLAADYGVPQLRERAVFIARANGVASFPEPTHIDPALIKDGETNRKPWVTVKDAIGDLPARIAVGDHLGGSPVSSYLPNASEYALEMQSKDCFPYGHVTRGYRKSVLDLISHMKPGETWDSGSARMRKNYERQIKQLAKRANIPEEAARAQLVRAGKINETFYKDYYWSAYTRLAWEAPALTITANANFLGSGRFTHPEEMRGITIREAARLQSFDDDFQFVTSDKDNDDDSSRIGVAMDMIGEAVPPKLAQALAEHISAQLAQ